MVQDGEGDGEMSRKGTSVIHYDQQFREEVVAFAKTTSRKEAKEGYTQRSSLCNSSSHCLLQVRPIRVNYKNVVEEGRRS